MKETPAPRSILLNQKFMRKMLYYGVILAIGIVTIHYLAGILSWYWIFKWFDIPLHVLGGAWAGYFAIFVWLFHLSLKNCKKTDKMSDMPSDTNAVTCQFTLGSFIKAGLIGAIVVGVSWEFLEHAYGLSGLGPEFRFDTVSDVINDMIGGTIASIIAFFAFAKK